MLSNLYIKRSRLALLLILAGWLGAAERAQAQLFVTNAAAVNVTPSGFSVVAAVSPALTASTVVTVSVYADAGGTSSLAGQVGVEYYPLNTGDPTATNSYQGYLSKTSLRQDTMGMGLVYARISDCAPGAVYYYQITVTNTNGQSAVWPASGPLPGVTTAQANAFVVDSQQLFVTLDSANPPGSIIMLSNASSPSILAAVVGDGAPTNQAFFNVNDLIAASGTTNYLPNGSQLFTATVLGPSSPGLSENYTLIFSNNFNVGGGSQISIGTLSTTVTLGNGAVLTGAAGSVPLTVSSESALASLSFTVNLETNLFSALSLQATAPVVKSASISAVASNSLRFSFTAVPGLNFQGGQQIATLNFTAASNAPSAFVPLIPQALQGTNTDGTVAAAFFASPGRIVIVGPQPLLDIQLSGAERNLVLYGIPGESYQLQSSTALANPLGWSDYLRVPMTNIMEVMSNVDSSPASVFFRAYQLTTTNPIVDASFAGGSDLLTIYGAPGMAVEFDYSTALGTPWKELALVPMTNAFAFVTGLSSSTSDVYYRYHVLNADPPVLQTLTVPAGQSMVAYGLAGSNYTLQYASRISSPAAWNPLLSYTLTNSFHFLNLTNTSSVFYRLKRN